MSRRRRHKDEAAAALDYGPKSAPVETHPAFDGDDDDPDPNGNWTDDDWDSFNERNS